MLQFNPKIKNTKDNFQSKSQNLEKKIYPPVTAVDDAIFVANTQRPCLPRLRGVRRQASRVRQHLPPDAADAAAVEVA